MGVLSTCCQCCSITSSTLCCLSKDMGPNESVCPSPSPLSQSVLPPSLGDICSADVLVTDSYLFRLSSLLRLRSSSPRSAWRLSASCARCWARAWAMGLNSAQSKVFERPSRLRSRARLFMTPVVDSLSTDEASEEGESWVTSGLTRPSNGEKEPWSSVELKHCEEDRQVLVSNSFSYRFEHNKC